MIFETNSKYGIGDRNQSDPYILKSQRVKLRKHVEVLPRKP